jgi:hypothetical protein
VSFVQACVSEPVAQDYLANSIGLALVRALDDLITSGHLTPQVAIKVLQQVSWL